MDRPDSAPLEAAAERLRWFEAEEGSGSDVAVVVHGLNQRPDRMRRVIEALTSLGYAALLVTLTGHDGDESAFRSVCRDSWLGDIAAAFARARQRAGSEGRIVLVGFSLGGLASMDYLASRAGTAEDTEEEGGRRIPFDRAVLFAPALALRSYAHWARLPGRFLPDFFIPSFSPADFRACRGTPGAAYRALFDMHDSLQRAGLPGESAPVLCFIDPKDEMVSAKGLRRLIHRNGLDWRIAEVFVDGNEWGRPIHHLIVEPELMGEEPWRHIVTEMSRFLRDERRQESSVA